MRLPSVEWLVDGSGEITIGRIGPIHCAATACDEHQQLAMLVRRPSESIEDLLRRLEAALVRAYEHDEYVDEINGEVPPTGAKRQANSRRGLARRRARLRPISRVHLLRLEDPRRAAGRGRSTALLSGLRARGPSDDRFTRGARSHRAHPWAGPKHPSPYRARGDPRSRMKRADSEQVGIGGIHELVRHRRTCAKRTRAPAALRVFIPELRIAGTSGRNLHNPRSRTFRPTRYRPI
jgi:hypothetical protein